MIHTNLLRAMLLGCVAAPVCAVESKLIDLTTIAPGSCSSVIDWYYEPNKSLPIVVCVRTQVQVNALNLPRMRTTQYQFSAFANTTINLPLTQAAWAMQQALENFPGRSLESKYFVAIAMEPVLGCIVTVKFMATTPVNETAFENPCHSQAWDLMGQVHIQPEFANDQTFSLIIPPYRIEKNKVVLGELPKSISPSSFDFTPDFFDQKLTPFERLNLAALWGRKDVVESILKHEMTVKALNQHEAGFSVLINAVSKQHLDLVRFLLKQGVNPNHKTPYGGSALAVARIVNNKAIIDLLIAQGAIE